LTTLENDLDAIAAETAFSGVVRVDGADGIELAKAYGLAHRGYEIPNEVDTRFAIASGTKGLTALTVVSLIEDGLLELSTPARSVLGRDLPLVGDDVTVEHLLSHRSGIGDYLDEEAENALADYLAALWRAFFAGRIVSTDWVAEMVQARSEVPSQRLRYGLGFWLHASPEAVVLEGCDAGVSFRTVHDPRSGITHTVIANTTDGAWPIARYLDERVS
jgi:CubicO group peptidase (beta-lactamase class C family)